MKPTILITVPCYHAIEPVPAMHLLLFAGHVARSQKYQARWCIGGPKLAVCDVRNSAVEFALSQAFTHVLFIDDDMIVPRDLLDRLLEHDVPIVTPLFYRSTEPHDPLIFKIGPNGDAVPFAEGEIYTAPSQLLDCPGGAGSGVMLIRRDVLEDPRMKDRPFRYPEAGGGADLHFCRRARELGFLTACDPTIVIPQMSPGRPFPAPRTGSE